MLLMLITTRQCCLVTTEAKLFHYKTHSVYVIQKSLTLAIPRYMHMYTQIQNKTYRTCIHTNIHKHTYKHMHTCLQSYIHTSIPIHIYLIWCRDLIFAITRDFGEYMLLLPASKVVAVLISAKCIYIYYIVV